MYYLCTPNAPGSANAPFGFRHVPALVKSRNLIRVQNRAILNELPTQIQTKLREDTGGSGESDDFEWERTKISQIREILTTLP